MAFLKLTLFSGMLALVISSPFDDGKYRPEKYNIYDDGKYYRSLNEGKYIPGDEGRYTYIYSQGLYPADDGDYRYIHQVGPDDNRQFKYVHQLGPNGGFGGNGGNGHGGGDGGKGPGGPNGPNGPNGPGGPNARDGSYLLDPNRKPNVIEYIGRKVYADRYPYIHKVIKSLVDEYVSNDIFENEESTLHFNKAFSNKELISKCRLLLPAYSNNTSEEYLTRDLPKSSIKEGDKHGYYYSFKGSKELNTIKDSAKSKVKLEYEVFVRVVNEVNEK